MIAVNRREADILKKEFPQFRLHITITPQSTPSGFLVGEYVWTPMALNLPASMRLQLRGLLAPLIDEESTEEEFPDTLLDW
jgi:hypothetical protein